MRRAITIIILACAAHATLATPIKSGNYYYEINADPNTVTIVQYEGAYGAVEIPSALDGKTVTALGNDLFNHRPLLTSLSLPATLMSIGDRTTVLWNPLIQAEPTAFGMQTNGFCFTIAESPNGLLAVTCSTNLSLGPWQSLLTRRMEGGLFRFADPDARLHPTRYYQLRMP